MTSTELDTDSEAPLLAEIERLHRRLDRERAARREAEQIAEAATRSSIEDPLTGLANRTLLTANLDNELARAARYARDVALFYLDLDRFKLVNDTYGHEAGDEILVGVADALRT
ncbi:MAG: GGDEF domain-containing protein, partial [Actinomycetota bacterium]